MINRFFFVTISVCSLAILPAQAAATYSVGAVSFAEGVTDGDRTSLSSTPVTASSQISLNGAQATSQSVAKPGQLGFLASSSSTSTTWSDTVPRGYPTVGDPTYRVEAGLEAPVHMDATGDISLNLNLHGVIAWDSGSYAEVNTQVLFYTSTYSLIALGDLQIRYFNGDASGLDFIYDVAKNISYQVNATGVLNPYHRMSLSDSTNLDLDLTTNTIFGVPADFILSLGIHGQTQTYGGGSISLDFLNTFGLPSSGPVFNLANGPSTVNSSELNLNNNSFTPVPEPSTALSCLIFALATWMPRRR